MRAQKLHAVVAGSTFASEKLQTPDVGSIFGIGDAEKVHADAAITMFGSQNTQSTPS